MKLAFKIALRFLGSNKGQTLLIALGIALGVAVQIFIGLLIQGLQKNLINTTVGNSSQITITSLTDNKLISNWKVLLNKLEKYDEDIINLTVSADRPAFIKFDDESESVLVRGWDFEKAEGIYKIKEKILEGNLPRKDEEILLGKDLADKLGLVVKDKVRLATALGNSREYVISGLFDLKVAAVNKTWVIAKINASQRLFDLGDKISGIEMQVPEVFSADLTAKRLKENLNDSYLSIDDWKSQNAQLLSGLSGQSVSSIMIQVFVLLSVVLGIASVLAITVMQKSKQLGILKAMGMKDKNSSQVFLFEGLLLGILGGILGIALGVGLLFMFTTFAVSKDGTPVVPIYFDYYFIAFSGLIAVVSAVTASLIPARTSSKLSPIEVIRNS